MSEEDDNTPYRKTAAYKEAAIKALDENRRQRRAATPRLSHFPDEPWEIPDMVIRCLEVGFSLPRPAAPNKDDGNSE